MYIYIFVYICYHIAAPSGLDLLHQWELWFRQQLNRVIFLQRIGGFGIHTEYTNKVVFTAQRKLTEGKSYYILGWTESSFYSESEVLEYTQNTQIMIMVTKKINRRSVILYHWLRDSHFWKVSERNIKKWKKNHFYWTWSKSQIISFSKRMHSRPCLFTSFSL